MIKEKTTISQRLINALLLNGSFIDNPGLLNGKMGISICFYHLARQTGNSVYEDYAGELIDEIYEEIGADTPFDFENGLAGIGWGIEYLVQYGFIEADTDEVLEEFDKRLMPLIYSPPSTIGLCNGLVGLGAYLLKRIQNPNSNDEKIQTLINKQLLIHLISEVDRRTHELSSIIREPVSISNEKNLPNESEACVFDLTWDYPALIWFLAELYKQDILNFKVEKIIHRLVEPLKIEGNLPKLRCNRLLLTLAFTKLLQTNTKTNATEETIKAILKKMQIMADREAVGIELPPQNLTIKKGTSGITWIYKELYELTKNKYYKTELEYWLNQNLLVEHEEVYKETKKNNRETVYGLLEGFGGLIFIRDLPWLI